jgi:hypothetical protein
MPAGLIGPLGGADGAPTFKGGGVNEQALPRFFRNWAGTAWGELLAGLPTEDEANPASATHAAETFRRLVREVLFYQATLGDSGDGEAPRQVERRSLIDWCEKFAKEGRWQSIRSYQVWCKTKVSGGGEVQLCVAIRHGLLAQTAADKRLREIGPDAFARRCKQYGVGDVPRDERVGGQRAVILYPEFVNDLIASVPDDGDA